MAKPPVARNAPRAKPVIESTPEPEAAPVAPEVVKKAEPVAKGSEELARIDLTKPYNMVWVETNGIDQKHYYQDGKIFDKVYKTEIKV